MLAWVGLLSVEFLDCDRCARGDRTCNPGSSSDYRVVAYYGFSSENCCSRIYYHIVAYIGMTLDSFYEFAVFSDVKALGSERYVLVNLDSFSYCCRFAYYDACTVIDEERIADGCR